VYRFVYSPHGVIRACLMAALLVAGSRARGQQDASAVQSPQRTAILEIPDLGPAPGAAESSLGKVPGALSTTFEPGSSTAGGAVVGGRRRSGRLPRPGRGRPGASMVAATQGLQLPESIPAPGPAPRAGAVLPASVIDTTIVDDPGPADGLSLDAAIDRMMAANLDVRALRHELTQADADVLTAGLRTNPLIYMDTQFIPYGSFTNQRPGGPTQYDLNITYPLDVSQKRQARTVVARMARSTLEAQFQDAVRRQIDNVYRAFVNLQSARIDMLTAQAAVRRQEQFLAELRRTARPDDPTSADAIDHLALSLERSRSILGDAVEAFEDAQEGLGVLLAMPPGETASLMPHGLLRDSFPPAPPVDELAALVLRCRPDVHAARLGVSRAGAEVRLQRANRFDDVYLFYDPITYQDNRPTNQLSSHSWAIGLTFALPIYNRNQGNIARAESNVSQTKLELSSLERRVVAEVRLAAREYERSREAVEQIERAVIPRMKATLARKTEDFTAGKLTPDDFQGSLDDAAEVNQSLRDAMVRHRRSMLDLNTAVGLRLLP
jgi:cobalt-zinc-cadmium efflux system outer membrane protein